MNKDIGSGSDTGSDFSSGVSGLSDQERYRLIKHCATKRRYETFAAAREQRGQNVYACTVCGAFHRTSRTLTEGQQILLIKKIFGSLTPAYVTAYNNIVAGKTGGAE